MMIKRLALLAALLAVCASAAAHEPSIVGTWVLTGADKLLPDGKRVPDYGPNPHGLVMFAADGYYSVQIYRAERLKFSSGDKFKGTAEEYQDASLSTSVHFGRYTVDPVKHTITFKIDRSSVPNLDDTTAVRPYELKGDELSWRVAARADGSVPITTLRRALDAQTSRIPLPNSDLPMSAAVWAGDTLYVSGSLDPDLKTHTDTTSQTVGTIKDLQKLLESQKLTLSDVVMMHVYLAGDEARSGGGNSRY
ncbi:MAG TPA: lipocalin-like domain-containing protein [Steroidobacteraceae bacterium]|nr:lipocalin-like domain-containing protein [Steroidobacteraceae bacterium]